MAFDLIGDSSDLRNVVGDVNKTILDLKQRETVQVFKDDTGTRRVLLGKGANGFYGLRVSKDGQDVYSAPDDQLVFNSSQNVFKIVLTGTATIPGFSVPSPGAGNFGENSGSVIVTHNLGFTPVCVAAFEGGSSLPHVDFTGSGAVASWDKVAFGADDTVVSFSRKIMMYGNSATSVAATSVKYYLLQETAN